LRQFGLRAAAVSWEKVLAAAGGESFARPGQRCVHRHWFVDSTMDELLQTDFTVDEKDRLYRCLDPSVSAQARVVSCG